MTISLTSQRLATLRPVIRTTLQRLVMATQLRRQRASLLRLDDHLLKDIGVTPQDAEAEARRSNWDAPSHWKS